MFLNLTLHPFRQRSNGETTLLVYADETCRQWHRDIEGGKSGHNLSEIVAERLENISNDLHDQTMVSSPMVCLLYCALDVYLITCIVPLLACPILFIDCISLQFGYTMFLTIVDGFNASPTICCTTLHDGCNASATMICRCSRWL